MVVYEIDRGLVGVLEETVVGELPNVEIRCADAARLDLGPGGARGPLDDGRRTSPTTWDPASCSTPCVPPPRSSGSSSWCRARSPSGSLLSGRDSKAYGVPSVVTAALHRRHCPVHRRARRLLPEAQRGLDGGSPRSDRAAGASGRGGRARRGRIPAAEEDAAKKPGFGDRGSRCGAATRRDRSRPAGPKTWSRSGSFG